MVDTIFWEDYYTANLDPIEKLLFLYFLTNSSTSICGVYQITIKKIAVETGIDKDMVEKIMGRFERDNKIFYEEGWVAIKNFIKHQNQKSPKIKKGIKSELENSPKKLKDLILQEIKGIDTLSHTNTNTNINRNTKTHCARFEILWNIYPRKINKKKTEEIWNEILVDEKLFKKIIESIKTAKKTDQWKRKIIMSPDNYLKQERWNDEFTVEDFKREDEVLIIK